MILQLEYFTKSMNKRKLNEYLSIKSRHVSHLGLIINAIPLETTFSKLLGTVIITELSTFGVTHTIYTNSTNRLQTFRIQMVSRLIATELYPFIRHWNCVNLNKVTPYSQVISGPKRLRSLWRGTFGCVSNNT